MEKRDVTTEWMRIRDINNESLKEKTIRLFTRLLVACWDVGDKGYEYGIKLQGQPFGLIIYLEVFTNMQNYVSYSLFLENKDVETQVERICDEINNLKAF